MTFNISSEYKHDNKNNLHKNGQPPVAFKGLETLVSSACANVQTGEIVGPSVVDIFAMIVPRTSIDATRSKDAGRETFLREVGGFVNNCIIPGFVAIGVGSAIGKTHSFFKKSIKVDTGIPVNSDTLKMYQKTWNDINGEKFWEKGATAQQKKEVVQDFVYNILNKAHGLVGKEGIHGRYEVLTHANTKIQNHSLRSLSKPAYAFPKEQGWISLKTKFPKEVKELAGEIADHILKPEEITKKETTQLEKTLVNLLGASEKIKLVHNGDEIKIKASDLVKSLYKVGNKILTKFEPDELKPAIEKINKVLPWKTGITMGIVMATGAFQQYLNRRVTMKRTGSDAFVGLSEESRKQADFDKHDEKKKFKLYMYKAASIAAIAGIAVTSLAGSFKLGKIKETYTPKNLLKKLEFNSNMPNLDHLRSVIYPTILVGRVCASTDKNELRETDFRDIPGYLNWLVLGPFVAKGVGKYITNGKLIKTESPLEKPGIISKTMHFFTKEHLMSHAEIDAKQALTAIEKKALRTKLNWSIGAGLAYSTAVLGIIMPQFNKYLTNKLTAKKKAVALSAPKPQDTVDISRNTANNEVFADFIKTQQKFRKV